MNQNATELLRLNMLGKKCNITSKDYQGPLRRPGEKRRTSTAQDGAKQPSSATNETEKGQLLSNITVAGKLGVEESQPSQVAEEKPTDKGSSEQKESVEEATVSQKTEGTNNDTPEAASDSNVEASSSTRSENLESQDTGSQSTGKDEDSKTESSDKAFTLSPFAAEFVPKSLTVRLQSAVDASEFVPGQYPQQMDRPMLLRQRSNKPENELMNCVKDVLFGLTQSPGKLHFYVNTLVNMLKKWLSSLNSLKEVVDLIFEYSITEPNFQYIAAKLCNRLSKEQNIVLQNGEKFRSVLMNRCRDEHMNREASLKNSETAPRLLEFAMFEAEFFCNYRPLGESEPLKVLHRGLLEMLNTLLQNNTEECLRCISKILKMTGFLLDDPRFMLDEKDRKEKVDKVFSDVEKLSKESGLSKSVKGLLSQVITLRATKWGSSMSEGPSGAYTLYPVEDKSFFPDYALGLGELILDDDLTPVTNSGQYPQQTDRPTLLRQRSNKPENELMTRIKDVLFGLTQRPGELHNYVNTLVNMLKKWLSSLNSLKEVVDLIFEYSITAPNFQYIAAKLCDMLSKEQKIVLQNGEKFCSVLMNRCRYEHVNREASLKNSETASRLLGFAMFEAELFCNYRPLGECEPLKVFYRGLLEMLNTLLQNRSEESLRCIGNMLKMTGYLLDDPRLMLDDKDRKEKVDKVFSDVEKLLSQESSLSERVKGLLSQVITLRASKWGGGTSEGPSGAYALHPVEDESYFPDYALGLSPFTQGKTGKQNENGRERKGKGKGKRRKRKKRKDELKLDDDLTPVTNPGEVRIEQWSGYYDDGNETATIHDTYRYYFPDQYDQEFSHEDDEDPEFDDEIDKEFEKFLQEQERLLQ